MQKSFVIFASYIPKYCVPCHTETMSNEAHHPETILTAEECWKLTRAARYARLGTLSDSGEIHINPVNILVHNEKIYFRTALGAKYTNLLLHEQVTIAFDRIDENIAYSVNLFGIARPVTGSTIRREIEEIGLHTWVDTPKLELVEITPVSLTGRRFKLS